MASPEDLEIESFQLAVMKYINFKPNCVYPYDHDPRDVSDFGTLLRQGFAWFSQPENSIDRLKEGSAGGDNYCKSELGLYHYAGLQTPKDLSLAESLWKQVASCHHSSTLLKAQVSGLLAGLYDDKVAAADESDPPGVQLWGGAMIWATKSIQLGLTSPMILKIAKEFSDLRGTLRPEMEDFVQPLWAAHDRREKEWAEERATQTKRVAKAPHKYRCANPKCPIECFRRGPLLKCAGRCPEARKPHYCSKSCQIAHWKQHKPECREGPPPSEPSSTGGPTSETRIQSDRPVDAHYKVEIGRIDGEEEDDIAFRGTKNALAVTAKRKDGSAIMVSSSTLSPELLRTLAE